MIQEEFARLFARNWVNAWNTHNLEAVMAHYADGVHFQSPMIVRVSNDASGTIDNKSALREYFSKALYIYPDLRFELLDVLVSIDSVVLYYKTINDMMTAEYMEFNNQGKVVKVRAHYSRQTIA